MSIKKEVKYLIEKGRVRATYYPESEELDMYTRTFSNESRATFKDFIYVMEQIERIRKEVIA